MVKEAKGHAADDRQRRECVEARNTAEALAYETEKNLKEFGDRLTEDQTRQVQTALDRLNEALKADSVEEIRSAKQALETVWQTVSTQLYQQGGAAEGQQQGPGCGFGAAGSGAANHSGAAAGPESDDGTIDADYEVVD